MNRRIPIRCFIALAVQAIVAIPLLSQSLLRVADPSNPVVTDQYESGGGSWVDVNRDGFPDLFVAHGNLSNQNNSLYLNDRHGGFRKVVTGAIATDGGSSIGSTWADYDNDGKADCFVTNRGNFGNFLYRGNGDSTFSKIGTGSVVTDRANSNSSSWVDLDGDGFVDLFVVNFQGNNYFYRNNGPPVFDFTRIDTVLPAVDGANFSICGAWGDMNNDRRPDLYLGNAGSQNDVLYVNNGNLQFTAVTIADGKSTLGASWGDYDNDGNLDLIVANYSNNGNRLYHNSGPPSYNLVFDTSSVVSHDAGSCVGSAWGDFNNDGALDLFVGNDGGHSFLYLNDGPPNYTFTKLSGVDPVTNVGNSFGCVWVDYDGDGSLDLYVANRLNQQDFLYYNTGSTNHWLEINLTGTSSNRTAIGATVRIKATINGSARWQMREVPAQTGYNSQNLTLHFGLGDATTIDSMKIEWPSGNDDIFTNVAGDRDLYIAERDSSPPVLVAPENGADSVLNPISFQWKEVTYGAPYWLQVSPDSTFLSSILVSDSSIAETSITLSPPQGSSRLFWRVRSTRSIYRSAWSHPRGFSLGSITFQDNVTGGWNLLSVPVISNATARTDLFPTATSMAFKYQEGYFTEDTLAPGIGYWLKFSGNQSVPLEGIPVFSESISVASGWNLVGMESDPLMASTVSSDPPGIIASRFFGYRSGYVTVDTLQPGRGYWVKSDQAGTFILSPGFSREAVQKPFVPRLSTLLVEDDAGNRQELYFGTPARNPELLKLDAIPPAPPAGIFDARFEGDHSLAILGDAGAQEFPIDISSAKYPVTISWMVNNPGADGATAAGGGGAIAAGLRIGGKPIDLKRSGSVKVADPDAKVTLFRKDDRSQSAPAAFSLFHCYPNPFNPVTTVRYQLPAGAHVRLEILDLLGHRVRTLVDEMQQEGAKAVPFDAGTLPSGMYICRLTAGGNSAVEKLMLTK